MKAKPKAIGKTSKAKTKSTSEDIEQKKTLEALRESEAKFSAAFHSTPTALVITRLSDSKFEFVNESFLKLVEYERDKVIGKTPGELNIFPNPEEMATIRKILLESKIVRNVDTTIRSKNGELRHVLFSVDIIQLNGQPHSLTTMVDITERIRTEKQVGQMKRLYATLSQVNQTIVRVRDRQELYQSICDVAVKFGGFVLAWIGLLDDVTGDVRPVAANGLDLHQWPFPVVNIHEGVLKSSLAATAIRTSKVIRSEDILSDHRLQNTYDQFQKYGYHSAAAIPFRLRGKTIGMVSLASDEIGLFPSREEVLLLDEMGLDISFALDTIETEAERKRAEAALRESEQQYRGLFETSPVAIYRMEVICDAEGRPNDYRFLYVNPAFERFMHMQAADLVGRTVFEAAPQADRAIVERLGWVALTGVPDQFEGHTARLNTDWEITAFSPQRGQCVTYAVDVTERKRAQAKVERQNQRLQILRKIDSAIISSFDLPVILDVVLEQVLSQLRVDASSLLLFDAKKQTLEYAASLGFRSDALRHTQLKPGEGFAGRAVLERRTTHIPNLLETGGKLANALLLEHESFVDYYGTPLIVRGEVQGVLEIYHRSTLNPDSEWLDFLETIAGQTAIAIDNTQLFKNLQRSNIELEQRVAQRTIELNQTNVELEHANRAKDEFLANMSHELRTPLNSILGLSESLLEQRRGTLNEHQQKSLQVIETSGQHLLDLINDILDLSKIEAGKFDFHPQPVSVDELCKSSLAFIKSQAAKKSIGIAYINNSPVSQIFADPRRLKQILVNLLTNAVKFTTEKGNVSLQVEFDPGNESIQFSVVDTGIGIALQDLQRLFQPFVQVDSGLNRQHAGTGLGLAIVQKLTEMHGGSVHVESEVGKGSRFTIILSGNPENLQAFESSASQMTRPITNPEQTASLSSETPSHLQKILLAEDNAANILTLRDYLESHDYEVIIAQDGLEAIARAEESNPDIILMDIQMPTMNGLEAITRLRADPHFAETPIIAITALAMPGDRERCLEAGANEYMSKPVGLKMLLRMIASFLNGK